MSDERFEGCARRGGVCDCGERSCAIDGGLGEWGRFLAELDRRIAKAERDDPARAERLKAMRPRLRSVDPAEGERRLDEVAPAFFERLNEGTGFDTPGTR